MSPFQAALHCDTISHLSDIVVRTGHPVQWDPTAERMVNGIPEQQALLHRPVRDEYTFV